MFLLCHQTSKETLANFCCLEQKDRNDGSYLFNLIDYSSQQKRDLTELLEKTAKKAESIGKAAIKFFLPQTNKLGLAAIKPIGKRQIPEYYEPQAASSFQPRLSWRSWIPSYSYYQNQYVAPNSNLWNGYNQYDGYLRSSIPQGYYLANPAIYHPEYYSQWQQLGNPLQTRTLNGLTETETSLTNFKNLVSKVNNAFLTYGNDNSISLEENLSAKQNQESAKDETAGKRRNDTPQNMKDKNLKEITDTFTDFVCGDSC